MNPVAELPLRDIHLPDGVSWWPPAIGWWLLPVIVILLLVLLYWLVKKARQPVLKNSARAEIDMVIVAFQQHGDKLRLVQDLSVALRRIGISYLPRDTVAGETGQQWYERLNQLVDSNRLSNDCIQLLSLSAYQKKPPLNDKQVESVLDQVKNWVEALSRGKADV